MKLLTQEIANQLPALRTTENTPLSEKKAVCKFFTPDSSWTWYAVEGQPEGDEFVFFGLVDGLEKEWGYFYLSELKAARGPMGLPIERDLHFNGEIPAA